MSPAAKSPPTARRTQAERRAATRSALLDATVSCLTELGYAGTTTALICERAGLSRTAHLHHYGSRAALVSAGVAHLADQQVSDLLTRAEALPRGAQRTARALDLMWEAFTSPLFRTAVDLWAAARTDPQLRRELVPVEHAMDREIMRLCERIFPDLAGRPDFERLMDFMLSTIRGLAVRDLGHPDADGSPERWRYAHERLLTVLQAPPG